MWKAAFHLAELSLPLLALSTALAAAAALAALAYTLYRDCFYAGWDYTLPRSLPDRREVPMGSKAVDTAMRGLDTADHRRILVLNTSASSTGIRLTIVEQSKEAYAYEVKIGSSLSCSCAAFEHQLLNKDGTGWTSKHDPEGTRHCKHLFWVKKEILRIPLDSPMFRRLSYRDWELAYILKHSRLTAHRAAPVMIQAYTQLDGTVVEAKPAPGRGDICTICTFELEPADPYGYCEAGCRSAFFHTSCLEDYRAYCAREQETPKCPQCRAQLVEIKQAEVKRVVAAGKERLSFGEMRPQPARRGRARSRAGVHP